MDALSESARFILDRMEPDRLYAAQDLRAFRLDTTVEQLREIMHELWIHRQVERVGYSCWRHRRSAPPHVPHPVAGTLNVVKPEDLFDHATFPEFFK
jgi:hypothetical protein